MPMNPKDYPPEWKCEECRWQFERFLRARVSARRLQEIDWFARSPVWPGPRDLTGFLLHVYDEHEADIWAIAAEDAAKSGAPPLEVLVGLEPVPRSLDDVRRLLVCYAADQVTIKRSLEKKLCP